MLQSSQLHQKPKELAAPAILQGHSHVRHFLLRLSAGFISSLSSVKKASNMKKLLVGFSFLLCNLSVQAAPASVESIEALLKITDSETQYRSVWEQMDQVMQNRMHESLKGRQAGEREKKMLADTSAKISAIVREEMSLEKLRPASIQLYQENFSQEEVDGMLAFYKTPAGQAMLNKMPQVTEKTMQYFMQSRLGPMTNRIKAVVEESSAALQKQ